MHRTLELKILDARFGADWFRSVGDPKAPGTMLVTRSGALREPGVVEVPTGTTLPALLGGGREPVRGLCLVAHHAEIPIWIERCDIVKECCTRLLHVRFVTAQIDELLTRLECAGNAFTLCAECLTQTTRANNNHNECCK